MEIASRCNIQPVVFQYSTLRWNWTITSCCVLHARYERYQSVVTQDEKYAPIGL